MSAGILGITKRHEPRQWIAGRYVTVKQEAKKSPEINPGNPQAVETAKTFEKGRVSNVCE